MKKITIFLLIPLFFASCKKKYVETIPTVSFTQMSSPVSSNLTAIQFLSSSEGFIAGENGKVFKTNDGGNSWTNISLASTTVTIHKIVFQTTLKGYLATTGGLYRTTDGGATWTNPIYQNTYDVQLFGTYTGYAIIRDGSSSYFYRTYDGGLNWAHTFSPPFDTDLSIMSFINEDIGYVAGSEAKIYETTDGGDTWFGFHVDTRWKDQAYTGKIADMIFTGYRSGYVTGNSGYLNKISSFDNYPSVSNITPLINEYDYNLTAIATRGSHAVAVGVNSILMPYPEFGSGLYSWTFYLSPEGTTIQATYNDVTFIDDNSYIAVGNGGIITKFKYPN